MCVALRVWGIWGIGGNGRRVRTQKINYNLALFLTRNSSTRNVGGSGAHPRVSTLIRNQVFATNAFYSFSGLYPFICLFLHASLFFLSSISLRNQQSNGRIGRNNAKRKKSIHLPLPSPPLSPTPFLGHFLKVTKQRLWSIFLWHFTTHLVVTPAI